MKALFILKSAIDRSVIFTFTALVSLMAVVFPEISLAASLQTSGQSAQVFEIKDSSLFVAKQNTEKIQSSLSYNDVISNDPLVIKLKTYLENLNSPLAVYAGDIVHEPQWQRALAISWVESNMGRRCADNNCSGIGVAPGHPLWRKYPTKLDWFKDMCQLLEKPIYKEKYTTFRKMKGVYVQPGSEGWVNGAQQKYNQLMALTAEAETERLAIAQSFQVAIAETTHRELATFVQ